MSAGRSVRLASRVSPKKEAKPYLTLKWGTFPGGACASENAAEGSV